MAAVEAHRHRPASVWIATSAPATRRPSIPHANAPLTELGRLRLARCVVDDGWPLRRREVLGHVLIMGQAHARQVLAAHQMHYNEHRPHQSRDELPPDAVEHPAAIHDPDTRRLLRTRILGGLINEYSCSA